MLTLPSRPASMTCLTGMAPSSRRATSTATLPSRGMTGMLLLPLPCMAGRGAGGSPPWGRTGPRAAACVVAPPHGWTGP
eukprot:13481151-Alexandrium_andersonii.AAC.1